MNNSKLIDTSFDFRKDASGPDPDSSSQTLKRYHQLLWSKPLPNGQIFKLDNDIAGSYLVYVTPENNYYLTSDSIVHSYSMKPVCKKISQDKIESFKRINSTIGGYLIFPGNRVDGKMTINGARGCHAKIKDRFDLTLECIRLFYLNEKSPLSEVFKRYTSFFALFKTFKEYIDFFLLQDLVSSDYRQINYFTDIARPFESTPIPITESEYYGYRENAMSFVQKRNKRIQALIT